MKQFSPISQLVSKSDTVRNEKLDKIIEIQRIKNKVEGMSLVGFLKGSMAYDERERLIRTINKQIFTNEHKMD